MTRNIPIYRILTLSSLFILLTFLLSGIQAEAKQIELPLGSPSLSEKRTVQKLSSGLTYTKIERGQATNQYTVEVGFFEDQSTAQAFMQKLTNNNFNFSILPIKNDQFNDIREDIIGYSVRSENFTDEADAELVKTQLSGKGFAGKVIYNGFDGSSTETTGPWIIHILEIERKAANNLHTTLANGQVSGKETVSSMAARSNALAAINGGYFVTKNGDGTTGDLAGISVIDGELLSEGINHRSGFVLSERKADVSILSTQVQIKSSDGYQRDVNGMNRTIGLIRSCGSLTNPEPMHDVTCHSDSELILYKPIYDAVTPIGNGVEVVLNEVGEVIVQDEFQGHIIPRNGSVLSGTGEAAVWLRTHAAVGMTLITKTHVQSDNRALSLTPKTSVVNGGPLLLKNNQIFIDAEREGFKWSHDFFYRFGINRNPRTLAGSKPDGTILLVAADGRNPQISVGLSFQESAEVMRFLGAKEALNLDGGGSTTMVINGNIVNHPSDAAGERPVGDAILFSQD